MLRLFTCIWIPDEIREKIVEFQKTMQKLPMDAKFVEKENLHLTITFLGDKPESEVERLSEELDRVATSSREVHVKLEGLKIIPSESYIRVIGVHVKAREIEGLIKAVAATIDGDYHEGTKLTLCRVKSIRNKREVLDFIESSKNISFGEFNADSIALVKSTITRQGPAYETIHESPLS